MYWLVNAFLINEFITCDVFEEEENNEDEEESFFDDFENEDDE